MVLACVMSECRWEDCEIGVLFTGGLGHVFRNNSFAGVDKILWGGCPCANSSSLTNPADWAAQYAMLQKVSQLPIWRSTFPASLLAPTNESLEQWSKPRNLCCLSTIFRAMQRHELSASR